MKHQAQVITPLTIAGDGTKKSIASLAGVNSAKWFQLIGANVAASASRIGDVNTSPTQGFPLGTGTGQFFPPMPDFVYDLTQHHCSIAAGDSADLMVCVEIG